MIVSTGGDSFFSTARPAMVASVPATVCCRPVVPQRTMATGVSGDIPCAMSDLVQSDSFSVPMSTTLVPGILAI